MFEAFEKYLTEKADLDAGEINAVRAVSIEKKLRKSQYLLQEGDVCHYSCFIVRGCLRMYTVGDDGIEHILRFAVENWWISDRESFNNGSPSRCNIDALENCEVILIEKHDFIHLLTAIPKFRTFVDRLLARSFDAVQNRIMDSITHSTEERYQNFVTRFPGIFSRVPLRMIASYLGVSRETLSRVRTQFVQK
ncbi:cAMP-binding domain of CRP or a regulatory subunit of cAMP-dependent protein kinases [Mucilaginibacter mallensis]|uniref:cAMP-binding domain of CRP or a regulatory subunit of cAMP-dependent protein kinases n=1 Tax=Mucilaginibacter mallensis TaxID=652787 RepID=A0A1H2CF30_MUCMA|nr:Crp/Fnr family transcriptional regulator [Mucilaginibacter mallensis]SDT68919.1 cAMP-binding domain of CRP or a regulatory subunit of cAMP-dependent protein kinases [Mucilaginibacter mallensis]